jgi:MFS family permease
MLCFFLITGSNILMGPSSTFKLDANFVPLFFIGLAVNGIAQGFLYTPMIPEILDAIYSKQKVIEGQDEILDVVLADRASGYYGVFNTAGTITAPIIGSFVYETLLGKNWPLTCDIFALAAAIYSVIYTVFNVLPDVHKEKQELQEITQALLSDPKARDKIKSVYIDYNPDFKMNVQTLETGGKTLGNDRKTIN